MSSDTTKNGYLKTNLIDVDGFDGVECENCKERYVVGFTRKIELLPYLFAIIVSIPFGAFLHQQYQNHLAETNDKVTATEISDNTAKVSNLPEAILEMSEIEIVLNSLGNSVFEGFEMAITYAPRDEVWVGLMTMEPRSALEREYIADTRTGAFNLMKEALLDYKRQSGQ